ncbi:MAG: STAS domain-containing protein [bacterium]
MLEIFEKRRFSDNVIHLKGELVRENAGEFKKKLMERIERNGSRVTVLDLWELDFVDSVGLGAMVDIAEKMRKRELTLKISRVNPDIKKVLSNVHLGHLLT